MHSFLCLPKSNPNSKPNLKNTGCSVSLIMKTNTSSRSNELCILVLHQKCITYRKSQISKISSFTFQRLSSIIQCHFWTQSREKIHLSIYMKEKYSEGIFSSFFTASIRDKEVSCFARSDTTLEWRVTLLAFTVPRVFPESLLVREGHGGHNTGSLSHTHKFLYTHASTVYLYKLSFQRDTSLFGPQKDTS